MDTVVSTLVMCTVDDVSACSRRSEGAQAGARTCSSTTWRPGTPLRTMQEALNPLNRAAYEGCRLMRDPEAMVRATLGDDNCDINGLPRGAPRRAGRDEPGGRGGAVEGNRGWVAVTSCSPRAYGVEGVIADPPVVGLITS